jgi:hypothetical protein
MAGRPLTRRQAIAGGLGLLASAATAGGVYKALEQFGREDLIPGRAVDVALEPERWRTTEDQLAFVALGDNGSGGQQAMAVAEQLALSYREEPFGLVSLLGDICYYGHISERFDDVFVKPMRPLIDAGVQFELAVGNHDGELWWREGVPDVQATLELLGTPARYYSVERGPAELFYLDTGILGLLGDDPGGQLEWLDAALVASSRRWKIVCGHHPMYSSGTHGPWPGLRERLEPVLVRHHVDLYLAGHDHHYERTYPMDGVTHIVSGGGCKLTPVDPQPYAAFADSVLEFVRFDIGGDRLTGRTIGVDGDVLDRFELRAREGR